MSRRVVLGLLTAYLAAAVAWSADVGTVLPDQPFSFQWKAVQGAGGYRADVRNPASGNLVSRQVGPDELSAAFILEPGPYELRLTTLNRLGQDESSTPWVSIHVAAAAAPEIDPQASHSLVLGQSSANSAVIRGWARDGTASLRSPSGRLIPLTPVRKEGGRVDFELPALGERGAWDLIVLNPPRFATVVSRWISVDYPRPEIRSADSRSLEVSDTPVPLAIEGKNFSPEIAVVLRRGTVSLNLEVVDRAPDRVVALVPPAAAIGDYEILAANSNGSAWIAAGPLRLLSPSVGTIPVVSTVEALPRFLPEGIAVVDRSRWFASSPRSNRIMMIENGRTTVFSGTEMPGFSDGGLFRGSPSFRGPRGLALDRSGNLYVADTGNHSIRKITPSGAVSTLAGNGAPGFSDGKGRRAGFRGPHALAVDGFGVVWVADGGNAAVRRIAPDGTVTTLPSGGWKTMDSFTAGPRGELAVLDWASGLIWLSQRGSAWTSVVAGPGLAAICYDSAGRLMAANTGENRIVRIAADGSVPWVGNGLPGEIDGAGDQARLETPDLLSSGDGFLLVSSRRTGIWRIVDAPQTDSASGSVSTLVAPGRLSNPKAVAVDGLGVRYYLDDGKILRDEADAGLKQLGAVDFSGAVDLAPAPDGTVYVADTVLGAVFRVSSSGRAEPALTGLKHPSSVAVDGTGRVFVAERDSGKIVQLDSSGISSVLFSGFSAPRDVEIDRWGFVYVAEEVGIWKCDPETGARYLLAGVDAGTGLGKDEPYAGLFSSVQKLAALPDGSLAATDSARGQVVIVLPGGGSFVAAGRNDPAVWYQDGAGPTAFHHPDGIAVDPQGRLIVADSMNRAIRIVSMDRTIPPGASVLFPLGNGFSETAERRSIAMDGDLKDWAGAQPVAIYPGDDPKPSYPGSWPARVYLAQDEKYFYWMMTFRDGRNIGAGQLKYRPAFGALSERGLADEAWSLAKNGHYSRQDLKEFFNYEVALPVWPWGEAEGRGGIVRTLKTNDRTSVWKPRSELFFSQGDDFIEVRLPKDVLSGALQAGGRYVFGVEIGSDVGGWKIYTDVVPWVWRP